MNTVNRYGFVQDIDLPDHEVQSRNVVFVLKFYLALLCNWHFCLMCVVRKLGIIMKKIKGNYLSFLCFFVIIKIIIGMKITEDLLTEKSLHIITM